MLTRILFVVTFAIACCMICAYLGARFFISPADGLSGGALVFWFLAGGLIAGCGGGIILSRRLTGPTLFKACMISSALAIVLLMVAYARFKSGQQPTQQEGSQKPTAVPAVWKQQAPQPLGLGMAKPFLAPAKTLYVYMIPDTEQLPGETKPADSITFVQKQGFVDIATAPPYLVPEVLKLDYNAFYFRVVSLSRYWVEVIVNTTNGHTAFLDREAVEYLAWPDFFLNVHSVERLNAEKNPVRARPMDTGSIMASGPNIALTVVSVHGDWLKVATNGLADRMPPYGYIRWRDGNQLLVRYSLFS